MPAKRVAKKTSAAKKTASPVKCVVIVAATPKKRVTKPKTSAAKKTKKTTAGKAAAAKRPLTGYIKFAQAERAKVKKDHPSFTFTEIGRELGRRWRALSDAQKAKY